MAAAESEALEAALARVEALLSRDRQGSVGSEEGCAWGACDVADAARLPLFACRHKQGDASSPFAASFSEPTRFFHRFPSWWATSQPAWMA